jgi:tetratricopeptide (TPR) repeat protein
MTVEQPNPRDAPGVPIMDYCDRQNLTIRARLELFARVCDVVQNDHAKGIVRHQIQPSNVLVDGSRVVISNVEHTIDQAYSSPERFSTNSTDVDWRSDIYALGVLLYELLSGTPPIDPQTLRNASPDEVPRIIREVHPPAPSEKLSRLDAATASTIVLRRDTTRPVLVDELRRELEWIPLRAIQKDRGERYRSAAELADDVRRYLAGEPLIAGTDLNSYRLRKFVQRHRGLVIAAGAAAAAILAGVVIAFVMLTRARNAAVAARVAAEEQGARAEANFALAHGAVAKLLKEASPELRAVLREPAAKYLEQLRNQLGDDPAARAQRAAIAKQLADFACDAGDYPRAELLLREAFVQEKPNLMANPLGGALHDLSDTLTKLARVSQNQNKVDAARKYCDDAVGIVQARTGGDDESLALSLTLSDVAGVLQDLREFDKSVATYKQALERQQRVADNRGAQFIPAQRAIAQTCGDLGSLMEGQGKMDQAVEYYTRAVIARQAVAGMKADDRSAAAELAASLESLAQAQAQTNNVAKARDNTLKAIQVWRGIVDDPNQRELSRADAMAYVYMAWDDLLVGDPKRALEAAARADQADPTLPEVNLLMAHALLFNGKVDQAKSIYKENWLKQIPPGGTFAERTRDDFATLRKYNRESPAMRQIEAELMQVSEH